MSGWIVRHQLPLADNQLSFLFYKFTWLEMQFSWLLNWLQQPRSKLGLTLLPHRALIPTVTEKVRPGTCRAAFWTEKGSYRSWCLHANTPPLPALLPPLHLSDAMVHVPRGPVRPPRQPQTVVDRGVLQKVPDQG